MSAATSPGDPGRRAALTDEEIEAGWVGPAPTLNAQVVLSDYDPEWPRLYAREAERITRLLGDRVLRLEHAGSTSVPGLPAKPIIDIVLVVADSADEDSYLPPLEAAGYRLVIREPGWHQHRALKGPDTNINLHVYPRGSTEPARMLMFRDWLRANPADRDLYADTKRELAARTWKYIQHYADAKSEVVGQIMARAEAAGRARYFDGWYADMAVSPVKDEIQRRHLGLPPQLLSTSLLGWDGIAEVTAQLRLPPGGTLADLACGRGGYGLEISARTGARLVGVDFSGEAIRQAREQARRLGRPADFRVGDLAATGLADGSVSAVLCVDAIQFAPSQAAACTELRRVLAPGGRAVLTCWEPLDRGADGVPDRLRQVDLAAQLAAAGFTEVEVADRPQWRASERSMWEEAAALDPGDDPALRSFHDEGVRSLRTFGLLRRVLATATAP